MTKTRTVDRWQHLTAFARAEIVPAAQQFVGTMRTQRFGAVNISQVEVGRHRVNRSVEHVRSSRAHNLIVGLQLRGHTLILQDGRIAALSPGDITVYTTARPYSIVADEPMVCMGMKLPPTMLTVQDGLLENVTARCLSPDNTLRTSFIEVLRAAAHPDAPLSDAARPLTARMLGDMVSIMCINEAELLGLVDTPQTDEDLIAEVLAYAYAHLSDPALTAGEVAASCHISVRPLYHLLAARGIKLSAWIRTQRLEKCRHALADPQLAHLPVAQIAARWGFRNAAYFSTVFRAEFGSSPDAYRRRTRTAAELTEAGPR